MANPIKVVSTGILSSGMQVFHAQGSNWTTSPATFQALLADGTLSIDCEWCNGVAAGNGCEMCGCGRSEAMIRDGLLVVPAVVAELVAPFQG